MKDANVGGSLGLRIMVSVKFGLDGKLVSLMGREDYWDGAEGDGGGTGRSVCFRVSS